MLRGPQLASSNFKVTSNYSKDAVLVLYINLDIKKYYIPVFVFHFCITGIVTYCYSLSDGALWGWSNRPHPNQCPTAKDILVHQYFR